MVAFNFSQFSNFFVRNQFFNFFPQLWCMALAVLSTQGISAHSELHHYSCYRRPLSQRRDSSKFWAENENEKSPKKNPFSLNEQYKKVSQTNWECIDYICMHATLRLMHAENVKKRRMKWLILVRASILTMMRTRSYILRTLVRMRNDNPLYPYKPSCNSQDRLRKYQK